MQFQTPKAAKPRGYGLCSPASTIQTRRVWFDLGYFNMVIYTILYCYSTPFPHIIFRFTYF